MKALKTKVILSAAVLLFALVATIGSTFAWFTVTNIVDVTTPKLQIQAVDSLLIKIADPNENAGNPLDDDYADPTTYSQGIAFGDFASFTLNEGSTYPYANLGSWTLFPVSAVNDDYDDYLEGGALTALAVGDDRPLTGTPVYNTTVTGQVIRMKFWVMAQSDNNALKLNSILIDGKSGTGADALIEGSVRIAVTIAGDGFVYGNAGEMDLDYTYEGTDEEATVAWSTLGDAINKIDDMGAGKAATILATAAGSVGVGGSVLDSDLDALEPMLVTVEIFIEGWDADAVNEIIANTLDIAFAFTIATE